MIEETDELITPQLAKEYLDLNTNNWRKLSRQRVLALATDMAAGRWVPHTGTIDFTEDGQLGDGQHRLAAIVESGVAIPFRVRRNVPVVVIENIDSGPRRTFAELLRHRGEPSANELAATVTLRYRWGQGVVSRGGGNNYPTTPALMGWYLDHRDIRDYATLGARVSRAIRIKGRVIGAALYEFAKIDRSEALVFADRLMDGVGLSSDDPILHLRNQAIKGAASRFETNAFDDLALTIKAWNAWITGQPMRLLFYRRGGSKREPFPEPVDERGVVHRVRPMPSD